MAAIQNSYPLFQGHPELSQESLGFIQSRIELLKKHFPSDVSQSVEIFKELEKHLRKLKKKWKKTKTSKPHNTNSFENYIHIFLLEIKGYKGQLCETMYISLFQKNEMHVTEYISYIIENGSCELKKAINALLVLKSLNSQYSEIKLSLISRLGKSLLIPSELTYLIPERRGKPRFLNKGHNFRYEFFQDSNKVLLLEKLLKLSHSTCNLTSNELLEIQTLLNSQLALIDTQKVRGIGAIFRQESNQLIDKWKTLLLDQQAVLLNCQKNSIKAAHSEHAISDCSNQIQNNLQDTLSQLVQGKGVETSIFAKISQYYYEMSIAERKAFIEKNWDSIQSLSNIVLNFVSNQPEQLSLLTSNWFLVWIEQCGKFIQQYANEAFKTLADQAAADFIARYTNYLVQRKDFLLEPNPLLIRLELCIEKIFSPENAQRVNHLKIARELLLEGKNLETVEVLFRWSRNRTEQAPAKTPAQNPRPSVTTLEDKLLISQSRLEKSKALLERIHLSNLENNVISNNSTLQL